MEQMGSFSTLTGLGEVDGKGCVLQFYCFTAGAGL